MSVTASSESLEMPLDEPPKASDKSESTEEIQKLRRESSCSLLSTILSLPLHEKSLTNYKSVYIETTIAALQAGSFEAFKKLFVGFDVSQELAFYRCDKTGGNILHVAVRSKNINSL